jgi:hypothetical protein
VRRIVVDWKKVACGAFFGLWLRFRSQKAWFLRPGESRSYARAGGKPKVFGASSLRPWSVLLRLTSCVAARAEHSTLFALSFVPGAKAWSLRLSFG